MRIAPGTLITAAFIGPGTVTTATLAGARYGYVLLWGIVFSVLATIILQEMSMRLGVAGRKGLGQALRERFATNSGTQKQSRGFIALATLVILAIGVGNAAYQSGNLGGAALGLSLVLDGRIASAWLVLPLGLGTAMLLASNRAALVKAALAFAVGLMSLLYVGAALLSPIDWSEWLAGLLPTCLPSGAEWLLIGLIGTTVVPYNLFLHARAARDHYPDSASLSAGRWDTIRSVGLGGLITLAIASLSAAAFAGQALSADASVSGIELATPLAAVLGPAALWVVGLGYFAAGITSAVTAPLAAAIAVSEILGWSPASHDRRFRLVWLTVLLIGMGFAMSQARPVPLILVAQATNGILLPLIAGLLLWMANDRNLLGEARNGWLANALGLLVLGITVLLGARSLYGLFAA